MVVQIKSNMKAIVSFSFTIHSSVIVYKQIFVEVCTKTRETLINYKTRYIDDFFQSQTSFGPILIPLGGG